MTVLAIGAHPDDLEILCAGTLAKCISRGDQVVMGSLTNGNVGHPDIDPPEMARMREAELRNSAKLIGAGVLWIGFDDELSEVTAATRLAVTDAIRSVNPDLIITHNANDYHVDHQNAYRLVFEAAPLTCVKQIRTAHQSMEKQPLIYTMDSLGGIGFAPTELVDITDTLEIKHAMFACHESQTRWLEASSGFDFHDVIDTVAKFRGYQGGVRYAEGFVRVDAWYRGTTNRVLP